MSTMQHGSSSVTRFSPGDHVTAGDRIAIGYLVVAGLILLTQWGRGFDFQYQSVVNLVLATLVVWTARRPPVRRVFRIVRDLYPLVLIGSAFVQVGLFARLIYGDVFTFDPLVQSWDSWLFGSNPHTWLHAALDGRFAAELMHLLYSLYFPLLGIGMLYVRVFREADFARFKFIFLSTFLTFVAVFIVFPVTGPLGFREGLFGPEVLGASFIDFLYSFGIPDPGGAFPSSHVGQSVAVYLLLRPMKHGPRVLIIGVILGIGVSMAYISVHYAIDAIAGVPAGLLFFYLWNGVYRRYLERPDRFGVTRERKTGTNPASKPGTESEETVIP